MHPETRTAIRAALRLAIEHHPLCGEFRADRFHWGRFRVCSGCAVAFPALIVGQAVAVLALFGHWAGPWPLLAASLVLGLPQLTTYLHRGGRVWRAAVKLLGGVGLGTALVAGFFVPVPWAWKWAALALLMLAFAALQALRLRSMLRTCDACPWKRAWHICPGFSPWAELRAAPRNG